ncbi:MAG TPA: YciI family protein [Puia sp.]|nr:YciI family protein [Puia sp.]
MKDYLLLFRGGLDFTKASPELVQLVITKWRDWVEDLTKKGIYNGGERVTRNEAAVMSGSAKKIIQGPYEANNEMVGGFISIKADSLQQAIEIAEHCPIFDFDGKVEIREIAKM